MADEVRIPNLNTLSTLIDRLSIENVKIAHFQNSLEHDGPSSEDATELRRKIATQETIIEALKVELTNVFEEALNKGSYQYIKEERTFN